MPRHREAALAAVAIQKQLHEPMLLLDCFASLAMTELFGRIQYDEGH